MRQVLKVLAEALIGLAIGAMVLGVLLPLLIRADYLRIGSPAGLWIIGVVIAACVALAIFRPRRSPSPSHDLTIDR